MINPKTEHEEVELELAEKAIAVEKYEALELLLDDTTEAGKAFKLLVLDGYLKDEAVRLTSLLARHGMEQNRSKLFEALAGVSHFENYLYVVQIMGAPSQDDVEDEE